MINIFSIDRHELLFIGLNFLFKNKKEVSLVGTAFDVKSAINQMKKNQLNVDIILVDLNLDGGARLNHIEELSKSFPKKKVVVFTDESESIFGRFSIKKGAWGYIKKYSETSVIIPEIETIHKLERQDLSKYNSINSIVDLSSQQTLICNMLRKGHTPKEIAKFLNITLPSLTIHKKRAMAKMDFSSEYQLFSYFNAVERG